VVENLISSGIEDHTFGPTNSREYFGLGFQVSAGCDRIFYAHDFKTLPQSCGIVSEFQFETHKTCGSCRANCMALNQKQSVVLLAIGQKHLRLSASQFTPAP